MAWISINGIDLVQRVKFRWHLIRSQCFDSFALTENLLACATFARLLIHTQIGGRAATPYRCVWWFCVQTQCKHCYFCGWNSKRLRVDNDYQCHQTCNALIKLSNVFPVCVCVWVCMRECLSITLSDRESIYTDKYAPKHTDEGNSFNIFGWAPANGIEQVERFGLSSVRAQWLYTYPFELPFAKRALPKWWGRTMRSIY